MLCCVPHTNTPNTFNLTQWFDAIDKDGNGQLTPMELQAALQLGRLNFSLATVAHIIRIHDKTGSGTISFDEFGKLHEFLTNVQQRWVCPTPSLCACMHPVKPHLCVVGWRRHSTSQPGPLPRLSLCWLTVQEQVLWHPCLMSPRLSVLLFCRMCWCSFEYFDKDQTNTLNFDEIQCALQHAGGAGLRGALQQCCK